MGKHSKIEPKKFSLLGSTGGLFATVLLAAGLFGASQISNSTPEPIPPKTPKENIQVLPNTPNPVVATAQNVPERGSNSPGIQTPTQAPTSRPSPKQPSATGTPASPVVPSVPPVDGNVDIPGLLGVDADVDLQKGLDVDLGAHVGSLLSADVDVEPAQLPEIDIKLLGE